MKTKNAIKVYLIGFMIFALLSCDGIAQDTQTPTLVDTFELNEPGTLFSSSSGGGIKVTTHQKPEVIVQTYVRKRGKVLNPSDPEVKDVLREYELIIEKNGTEVTAKAKRKNYNRPWNNSGIFFNIIVPKEMSCHVSSSGGGVKIAGVSGSHKFSSSGGSVKLENTAGNTKASSSGGGVTASNHIGDIKLSSSGGGVKLTNAKGHVNAHSSGGSVRLTEIQGSADASSSGGGVTVTGKCESVKATSSGGSVRVNISNLSKEIYLRSSGGGVDATIINGDELGLDLDLSSSKVNINLKNFTGKSEKNRIEGSMNGGGIPVYMRASGGNVNVKFD